MQEIPADGFFEGGGVPYSGMFYPAPLLQQMTWSTQTLPNLLHVNFHFE
jgi:hypothetical protein